MSESVSLPALGESVTEGTVTRWLKKVGDRVEVDEPLLEVSTDKVDTEIPSPVAGVIEAILVSEDETVDVGTTLVTIGSGEVESEVTASLEGDTAVVEAPVEAPPVEQFDVAQAAASRFAPPSMPQPEAAKDEVVFIAGPAETTVDAIADATTATEALPTEVMVPTDLVVETASTLSPEEEAPAVTSEQMNSSPAVESTALEAKPEVGVGYVTPLVRKLAHEHGINLSELSGTGVGGRIRKQDVLSATEIAAAAETPTDPVAAGTASPLGSAGSGVAAVVEVSALRGTTVPMSRLRKVIAERAVISLQSSAQLTSVVEVDVTRVAQLRDRVKKEFYSSTGNKLSFLPFFALAATEALAQFPIVNATIDGDTIVYPAHENIAIAVDTERGLLTPVIRDAAALDIAGFAAQIADLASRTRDNKLKPDELAGGTFTLTNTGSRGALFDTPIVFLPQSAILGTGVVVKKPVVISDATGDSIAIRSMVYLALSYDHRIVDGADAARFLGAVKNRLEGGDFEGKLGITAAPQ
ncbi:MAG: 2-oxoglutarate dehydrogenase, E2 component, dihydrolipoamide succinyltransferase [Rhodoglobus sp.]